MEKNGFSWSIVAKQAAGTYSFHFLQQSNSQVARAITQEKTQKLAA